MAFSVEQALAICTASLNNRIKTRATAYVMYVSNDPKRYEKKIEGFTVKSLINEFREIGTAYKYAFITKLGDDKVVRFYNSSMGKKFYSMTRVGGRRKSK